ncbi:MAG: hypothetical protein WCR21_05720, partial [Bacteroidota bacterium]
MTQNSAIFDKEVYTLEHNEQLKDAVKNRNTNFFLIKRLIDIVLSSIIVVLILSWLMPILAIFIKIDSRGPIFFK